MEFSTTLYNVYVAPSILVIAAILTAFSVSWMSIPTIVKISSLKGLEAKPNSRTSHLNSTPNLGGIAVFAGVILSTILFTGVAVAHEVKYIIVGMLVLFFIGLKDDLIPLVPYKKLLGQAAASLLIVWPGDFHLASLHGFWGIGDLPYVFSIGISFFFLLFLINAFNLVDGIDGLASGVGILASVFFGITFLLNGHLGFAVMGFTLAASLAAFFYFNVFSRKYKIFLGDTGSMLIGLLLGIFAIRFLNSESSLASFVGYSVPAILLGVLIVPVFDTFRIFFVRVMQGRSPFSPDRNHLHHHVLELSGSHRMATLIILVMNLLFVGLAIFIGQLSSKFAVPIEMAVAILLFNLPIYFNKSPLTD